MSQPGSDGRLRRRGRAQAARLRAGRGHRELRRVDRRRRQRRRHALRPALQGGQQVDHLVQRPVVRGRRRRAAGDLGRPARRRRRRSRRPACPRTRSAARTAGRSPTCSRTSTSARRAPRSTTSSPKHEIPWTDQSVKDALTEMAKIVGDADNIAGGQAGALQTDFPTSVVERLLGDAEGRDGDRGRLRPGRRRRRQPARAGDRVQRVPVPGDRRLRPAVVGGGDLVVMFKDNPAAQAFIEYLTTPEAAEIWAKRGGFSSPNKNVDASVYPDPIQRTTAGAIGEAEIVPLRPLRPAAVRVRRHRRPGPLQALPGLPEDPDRRRRDHDADGGRGREGVRLDAE